MSKYFNAIVFCLLVLVTASNGLEDGLRSMQSEKPMIVANVNEAMNSSKPIVNQVAKNGKKCCDGEKKECMACKNGMTLDEFCSRLPGKFGCDKSMKKEDRKEQIISEATATPL